MKPWTFLGMAVVGLSLLVPLASLGAETTVGDVSDGSLSTVGPVKVVFDTHYGGGFANDFSDELSRIQTMVPLAQLDTATQLGTPSYSQGFQHPVRVRFDDGAPAISENKFFYIVFSPAGTPFAQTLVVNVEAFSNLKGTSDKKDVELHNALNYEMAELILNDNAGGVDDQMLPEWVQEGTAIYLSGMGPALVEKVGSEVTKSHVSELVDDLNRPQPTITRREYARYYLAIRYIAHVGGSGTFQALLSDLLKNPSAANAIQDVLSQDWPTFEQHVRTFTTDAFMKYAREDEDTSMTLPSRKH